MRLSELNPGDFFIEDCSMEVWQAIEWKEDEDYGVEMLWAKVVGSQLPNGRVSLGEITNFYETPECQLTLYRVDNPGYSGHLIG